jgi:glycosyltransferase involved in cell wall biosynthesis
MRSGGLRTKGIAKQSSKHMPLITVITVVRNGEKTLEQTILSVIDQTYQNVEYIIIDGVSTDNTLDIVRKYEDRIDYWMSEPDGGIYYAMNKGIDLASGEWINFMNSGDSFYKENTVDSVIPFLMNLKIDLVIGQANICVNKNDSRVMFPKFNKSQMIDRFCHQACFFRNNNLFYDVKFKVCSDRALIQTFTTTKILLINIVICNYDITGISNKRYFLRMKETIKINNESMIFLKSIILYLRYLIVSCIKIFLPYQIVKKLENRNNV